ncbi:MAG: ribosome biogenesis GTPase Der [Rhodospirillales bacterium]|nr:ribosome biogenesis GTPase Der [Rhodospirillales bacterium]
MFTLALVGRPNVGKSTLFNRLAGKKLAIVDDTPGITRDWRSAEGHLFDLDLRVIDTAGLEESFDDSIAGRMRRQTEHALKNADAVLFMIDGRAGVTPLDEHFAGWLRKQKKPVILVVNKGENEKAIQSAIGEAYGLGLGEPVAVSAEHGTGMEELYHVLEPLMPEEESEHEDEDAADIDMLDDLDDLEGNEDFTFEQAEDDPEKPLKIAIVGRPNVGKSTLLNAIVQDQRVMTGPEAGITRDAIAVDWDYNDRKFRLVDTAGMRRKSKVQDTIEKMSVEDAIRAIRLAQIVILVIDAGAILEKQDLQIAEHIIDEGRALVLAVNKWDSVKNRDEALEELAYKAETSLAQLKHLPYQTISALNGKNINKLLDRCLDTYALWNKRIPTAGLNRWLARMESQNPAPLISGRSNRLKYITQIKTRPPTFALWAARPDKLPESHKRFIVNGLRRDYDIPGVPIRLLVRKSKNPYA